MCVSTCVTAELSQPWLQKLKQSWRSSRCERPWGCQTSSHIHSNTHHWDRISTCWLAYNHHPFFSLTPHTLSKNPKALPSPNQVAMRKGKKMFVSNKNPPAPRHTTHHFCQRAGLPSPAVAFAFTI